ncbi:MAG TPA: PVC-type heme-binding CxxCH protein [Gemmataceae bacterium]|nr:PVC-type heme-binding CxxCH protein [Gemmataceae bacterium]
MYRFFFVLLLSFAAWSALWLAQAAEPANKPYSPRVAVATDEAARAIKRFRLPPGVEARPWAAEPLLANPVAFCFDEQGRCYVAETFRLHAGVTDNRGHMSWLDDDLASRTVADRVAMYRRHLKDQFKNYEIEHDRVRLLVDSLGKGAADKATVFADGFYHAADGIGSGVLARRGNVYYTCIPDLWLLRDTDGDDKADVRRSLVTGFGIHVAFIGHDMHGLRMGPDGLLYFSIGDRGLNVKTNEGKELFYPDTGAVLRCEPDGSNLEVVHLGLRNPQELVFDSHGDLFTVDNNSDSGDRARLVQVIEGGDSGWRTGYQYGSALSDRGPWNAEKIWHLPNAEQPAFVVPPLAHITAGPSGLCYNYGATALPPRYADHFFVCDFHGGSGGSGVYAFAVKPKGASFEVVDGHRFIWSVLATDCDFGPDGAFYLSDWVEGWGLSGKGRIYRFANAEAAKNPAIAEVKKLLAAGFRQRSFEELEALLGHADLRVRQEAQFALAERGAVSIPLLTHAAKEDKRQLARLHAIWGLGQLGRCGEKVREPLCSLLADADAEVRRQAARAIGWLKGAEAHELMPLLKDGEPLVRCQAALSMSRPNVHFRPNDVESIWEAFVHLLEDNADRDAYLRHASVLAMARFPEEKLANANKHVTAAVRLAAVLALRQRKSPAVAAFLDDAEPRIVLEAARAIHDVLPPQDGKPLAERLSRPNMPPPYVLRALHAHFRLGQSENAAAVAAYAARADAAEKMRVEALKLLGQWAKPPRRDQVTGLTQDLKPRDPRIAAEAIQQSLGGIFAGSNAVRQAAAKVAASLGIKQVAPVLLSLAVDDKRPSAARIEALRALESLRDGNLEKVLRSALKDGDPNVRSEGRRLLAHTHPEEALAELQRVLEKGQTIERQRAFATLGDMTGPRVDAELARWLDKLLAGKVVAEARLDLLDAAARHTLPAITEKVQRYEPTAPKNDPLSHYRDALLGGDAEAGRRIFQNKAEVSCLRCHKVQGGGGEVGPDLTGIGAKQKREYLLESIVAPNKQIAKGFETLVLTMSNGKTVTGVLKSEDAREVRLMTAEGQLLVVRKDQIDERETGKSAMPEDLTKHLTRSEIRDLVEFLAALK